MGRFLAKLGREWRRRQLRCAGAEIASDLQSADYFIEGDARGFHCGSEAWFCSGVRVIIGNGVKGPGRLTIGKKFYVNHYAIIDCHCQIDIGDNVMVGPYAYVADFHHGTSVIDGAAIGLADVHAPVYIGDHVWLGAHAVVLKGVTIGPGAVVAAAACVTHDVPPMAIVAGVPARVVRMRNRGLDQATPQ
jgi:acetyltransferase-like isoleucine patch superfamily enzyme